MTTHRLNVTYAYRAGGETQHVRSHTHDSRSREEYAGELVTQLAATPGGWLCVDEDGTSVIFPLRELVHVRIEEEGT